LTNALEHVIAVFYFVSFHMISDALMSDCDIVVTVLLRGVFSTLPGFTNIRH